MTHAGSKYDFLIASIGNRDPSYGGEPTGPLRAAKEFLPSRTLLIATPEVMNGAEATKEAIESAVPGAIVEIVRIKPVSAALLADVQISMDAAIRNLQPDSLPAGRIVVCSTSGTPAITMALTLLATAQWRGARHVQALQPGMGVAPLLREFDTDAFWHVPELDSAVTAFSECRMYEAVRLLGRRVGSETPAARRQRPLLKCALNFAVAVNTADSLDPHRASTGMAKIGPSRLPPGMPESYEALRDWFARSGGSRSDAPERPVELCARAIRLYQAGRMNDALLAAAIATEVAAEVRLKSHHDMDPERLDPNDSRLEGTRARGEWQWRTSTSPDKVKLEGWFKRWRLLAELEPALAAILPPVNGEVRTPSFVEARNRLLHRGRQADGGEVQDALKWFGQAAQIFGWQDPNTAPSAPPAIIAFAGLLRSGLGMG